MPLTCPTGFHHNTLQAFTQVTPSKSTQTIWKAGECVPKKKVRNMTTKDNPGPLPINLYAANSPTLQPLDFTVLVLSEAAAVTVPHRETTETLYKLSQIVCVKADSSKSHQLFIIACLTSYLGSKYAILTFYNERGF